MCIVVFTPLGRPLLGQHPALPLACAVVHVQSMAFCQQLPYAFNVTLDCNVIATMPNITFNIGGKAFSVPVGDYAYQVTGGEGLAAVVNQAFGC